MGSCVRPELGIACCYPPRPRSAQEKWQRRFIQDALRGDLDSLATNRSSITFGIYTWLGGSMLTQQSLRARKSRRYGVFLWIN